MRIRKKNIKNSKNLCRKSKSLYKLYYYYKVYRLWKNIFIKDGHKIKKKNNLFRIF